MNYSMWSELADRIVDKIKPMINNGSTVDELQLFSAIEEVLVLFCEERISRVYFALPPQNVITKLYEKSRKRILDATSMKKQPQDLSRGS